MFAEIRLPLCHSRYNTKNLPRGEVAKKMIAKHNTFEEMLGKTLVGRTGYNNTEIMRNKLNKIDDPMKWMYEC